MILDRYFEKGLDVFCRSETGDCFRCTFIISSEANSGHCDNCVELQNEVKPLRICADSMEA